MHAREHNLRVLLGQRPRFPDQVRDRPRPVVAPCERRRTERAVLVAAILDFQKGPLAGGGV